MLPVEDDPDVHRDHLRGAVLRQRVPAHLDAAVGRPGPAGAVLDPARRDLARHRPAVPGQALGAGQGGAVHREEHRGDPRGLRHRGHRGHDVRREPHAERRPAERRHRSRCPASGCSTRRWSRTRSSSCSRCAATTASRRCSTSTATRSTARPATWWSRSRELDQAGLPDGQRNWANEHTVYTHGYGVVAAYGNQRDAHDKPVAEQRRQAGLGRAGPAAQGRPDRHVPATATSRGSTSARTAPTTRSSARRPTAGTSSSTSPRAAARSPQTNTYDGKAGVPVGGLFNKLLYAMKFSEPNIVLSSRVNENSKILYDRDAARAGAEGRAVADRRRRRLPRGGRRPGQVDPRRLHDHRPLPEQREGLAAVA